MKIYFTRSQKRMKLLNAGDAGPLFNNPELWTPTAGGLLHNLIAVALPTTPLLGSASILASGIFGTGTPGRCTETGLASRLLEEATKVLGRLDS
jgi:hypothetical protein